MASVNNIFLVNADPPVKRYVKTVPSKVGGLRFTADGKSEIGFILDSNSNGTFVYDDEVLEVYSDREDRAIRQFNKSLFTAGLLKEYSQAQPEVDMSNMLSDEEVVEIASIRNLPVLQKRIDTLTSAFTLKRILDAAESIGRPAKTVATIRARFEAVS